MSKKEERSPGARVGLARRARHREHRATHAVLPRQVSGVLRPRFGSEPQQRDHAYQCRDEARRIERHCGCSCWISTTARCTAREWLTSRRRFQTPRMKRTKALADAVPRPFCAQLPSSACSTVEPEPIAAALIPSKSAPKRKTPAKAPPAGRDRDAVLGAHRAAPPSVCAASSSLRLHGS